MCGIVGVFERDPRLAPVRKRLEAAITAMRHRGPDGSGRFLDRSIALGHTRLSIIDVAGGAQPLANEDGSVVTVFNGEIWNHGVLRRELERAGHIFATRCDTEVLVHGYEEWGDALVDHLHGMFAFAVWDSTRRRLLLARDPIGKKPLYLLRTATGIAFGSDARATLLVAGDSARPDPAGVAAILFQRYAVAPTTPFAGVERLPAGYSIAIEADGRETTHHYWALDPPVTAEPMSPPALRTLLRGAVSERLMSDVPVGVLLSGGVDSAAVLGLAREAGASDIATFTVGFPEKAYDERPLARVAAETHGAVHHEVEIDGSAFGSALARLSWYRDEPIAEPSEIPLLLLAEFAATQVKVTLGGDGGDEVFGGYPKYRAERLLRAAGPLAALVRATSFPLARSGGTHRRLERARETLRIRDEQLRWASWFRTFTTEEVRGLLRPAFAADASDTALLDRLQSALSPYEDLDPGRRMLLADFHTYLPDNMLLRTDKVLMAASIEGRVPLLDRTLVERASATSVGSRFTWRRGKTLLRSAVEDLVPRAILEAPKRGFPVPTTRLLLEGRGPDLVRMLLSERALSRGILEPDAVKAIVCPDGATVTQRDLKLFTLISLELWLRTNVDSVRLRPPESLDELLVDS